MSAVSSWLARLDAAVATVLGLFVVRAHTDVSPSDEESVYRGYNAMCFSVLHTYDEGADPRR